MEGVTSGAFLDARRPVVKYPAMTVPMNERTRPGLLARIRSRQAGHPAGLLGRIIGRAMVKDTKLANDHNLELLAASADETVLDLGFGQGRTVEILAARGVKVMGVDVSETMVAQATARNRRAVADGRVDLRVSDGVTLPFDDDSVDAVISAHTIYFWSEPLDTLAEIARVLRPGGRLVLSFQCGDGGVAAWKDPDVYRMYTAAEVIAMLEHADFEDVACVGTPDSPPSMRWATAHQTGS